MVEWIDHRQGQSLVVTWAVWLRPGQPSSLPKPTRSGTRQAVRQRLRILDEKGIRGARGPTNPSSGSRPAEPGASGIAREHVSIRRLQISNQGIELFSRGGRS